MANLRFIVNPGSGGGQGTALASALTTLLGPGQVAILGRCDLAAVVAPLGPDDAVIACGGDGTASAVAGVLAGRGVEGPALGVVPLGTGNDLARSMGWPGRPLAALPGLVADLRVAARRGLDCWAVDGPAGRRVWCNYLSIGIDARVAQHFHHLRLRHPRLIRGVAINRALYGLLGAQQRGTDLARQLGLPAGPVLPRWASVLVLCNIPSYAGGACLAAGIRCADGLLEAVALGHGVSLGLVTGRLRRPRLLRRLDQLTVDLGGAQAMQVDGEPFTAQAGRYRVTPAGRIRVLVAGGSPCAT